MKQFLLLSGFFCLADSLCAQYVYTIKADSVKITNCDSSELIIENHTQAIPGFLFNTGNGRTIFKKGLLKLNDSLYLIGADTLKLKTNAWIQGGNAFGTTGVLGTNDNNSLDLYTHGVQRARLTNTGNLLLGTTTDKGNLLQVNGNTGIGSATITSAGNLIGTNAILFNHFIPRYHTYHSTSPYISRLDDVLYNFNNRLHTTSTQAADGTWTIDIVFPPDEIGPQGIGYSTGYMYFSFWPNGLPGIISVMAKNYAGVWTAPNTTDSSQNLNVGAGLYQVPVTLSNWLTELKITISPRSGGFVNLQDMAYVLATDNEGLTNPYPYVSKYGDEHIYNYFYLKNGGVDNVRISPYLGTPNYFLNNMLIGASAASGSARLQVTGDVTATGNLGIGTATPAAQLHTTGTVRFAGLTSDTTKTRVLVCDVNGNLYYRDVSALAGNEIFNADRTNSNAVIPSLTVNGTMSTQRLNLSQDTLLKKIGDLNLYVINQEKKLETQEQQIRELQQQNNDLEDLRKEVKELKKMITDRPLK